MRRRASGSCALGLGSSSPQPLAVQPWRTASASSSAGRPTLGRQSRNTAGSPQSGQVLRTRRPVDPRGVSAGSRAMDAQAGLPWPARQETRPERLGPGPEPRIGQPGVGGVRRLGVFREAPRLGSPGATTPARAPRPRSRSRADTAPLTRIAAPGTSAPPKAIASDGEGGARPFGRQGSTVSRHRDESAIKLAGPICRERLTVFLRVPPTRGRPGFAPLIAAGMVVLLLNRNAVLFWPNRVAADVADRLLRCWGTCWVRCHLDGLSRTGCWTICFCTHRRRTSLAAASSVGAELAA
jgi:hypothetical protein